MKFLLLLNQKLSKTFSAAMLSAGVFTGLIVGTASNDILTDGNKPYEAIYANAGNDVVIYTPEINPAQRDLIDGGSGIDTLWLRVTPHKHDDPAFMTDLIRLQYFIATTANAKNAKDTGAEFTFKSINLKLRNIEYFIVESIDSSRSKKAISFKPGEFLPKEKNTAFDTLS